MPKEFGRQLSFSDGPGGSSRYEEKWAVRGSVLEVISGNASVVRWQNANEQGFDLEIHGTG